MPNVNIPDYLHHRLENFVPIARALLGEDADLDTVIAILVEAGLRDSLNAVIRPQEKTVLLQAFHQVAAAATELVYGHTADMLALGADLRAQEEAQRRIGFRPVRSRPD